MTNGLKIPRSCINNSIKGIAVLIFICSLFAETAYSSGADTLWNQTDNNGMKQGFWRINFENGKTKYQGFFKDNKPQGEMKRFYEDGTLKANIYFVPNSTISIAKLYYENGVLAGSGKYIGSLKDSVWKYYSYYDKSLKLEESYESGIKAGKSIKYYTSGKIAEEILWIKNLKEGNWNQYFENGSPKIKAFYKNDKREGKFETFYTSGKLEMSGMFENNLMQGEWIYYDEAGAVKTKIIYLRGIAQNAAQLEKQEQEYFKMIDDNKGKIPEPDENNIVPPK
jgi:antitoxin component YwqK of YwqJK toxin-antitoxin module